MSRPGEFTALHAFRYGWVAARPTLDEWLAEPHLFYDFAPWIMHEANPRDWVFSKLYDGLDFVDEVGATTSLMGGSR